jgi:hypothetical protein
MPLLLIQLLHSLAGGLPSLEPHEHASWGDGARPQHVTARGELLVDLGLVNALGYVLRAASRQHAGETQRCTAGSG